MDSRILHKYYLFFPVPRTVLGSLGCIQFANCTYAFFLIYGSYCAKTICLMQETEEAAARMAQELVPKCSYKVTRTLDDKVVVQRRVEGGSTP